MNYIKNLLGSFILFLTSCQPSIKMDVEELAINECDWIRFKTIQVDIHVCRLGPRAWQFGEVRNIGTKTVVE